MELCNRKALTEADVLLRMKHGMVRLDSVWGVVGGRRPVKHLVKKVRMLTSATAAVGMVFSKSSSDNTSHLT